jgi:hypothetical protein
LAFAALLSCASPDAVGELSSAEGTSAGSTDPLDHLRVIAGPEMAGRGTPSAGLDKAIDYVTAECVRAGLTGGFAGASFKQPFNVAAQLRVQDTTDADEHVDIPVDVVRDSAHEANNILALLPGAGPHKEEVVLLSAHLDHLGTGYPGADDNGSGSAALLAIANRLHARLSDRPLDRSVAFLWTTGEERGLLGSAYFTDNPPASLPLTSIAEVINLDAVGALDDTRFSILPDDTANTQSTVALIEEANREMERPFVRINRDVEAYTRRTDAWSFMRHHVPTIWVFEGLTNPQGGGTLMPRYHRPTDTVENLMAENGGTKLQRMTDMLTATVEKVATAALTR